MTNNEFDRSFTEYEVKLFEGRECLTKAINFANNSRMTIISVIPVWTLSDTTLIATGLNVIFRKYHR
jgi:hypothetical protein